MYWQDRLNKGLGMKCKCRFMAIVLFTLVLVFQGMLSVSAANTSGEKFSPEASVTLLNDKELSVDFTAFGELPDGTQVSIYIPKEAISLFRSGDELYLYSYNAETNLREYVGKSRCEVEPGTSGKHFVTFDIDHGSKYIITYEYQGETYTEIDTDVPISFYLFVVAGVILCCVVGVLVYTRIKNQKKLLPAGQYYDPTLKIDRFRG